MTTKTTTTTKKATRKKILKPISIDKFKKNASGLKRRDLYLVI